MLKLYDIARLSIFIFIALMVSDCSGPHVFIKIAVPEPEGFYQEIAQLEAIADQHADVSVRAKAHLQLAVLYSHYKNPNQDYLKALKELEMYISLDAEGAKKDEIQNWLAALRELQKITDANKQLAKEYQDARMKIEQLMQENKNLIYENEEIKKKIEELKHIDIRMEEKRRQVK